ncbi:hypothetical protein KI387_037392, partial [Taxus chinensis]
MLGKIWGRGRVYAPVETLDLTDHSKETYMRSDVFAPRATGLFLKIFVWVMRSKIFGPIVMYIMKAENLIHQLFTNAYIAEPPMYFPKYPVEGFEEQQVLRIDSGLPPREKVSQVLNCLPGNFSSRQSKDEPFFRRWTIRDFSRAYTSGEVTPSEVAERFLSAVERSSNQSPGMCIFISHDSEDIRRQAAGSTLRYKKGEQLSVLDGVPIAVKDEIDCLPYPTTGGTKWLHMKRKVTGDATCVKRLRECGAVLVGKTNMHELGVGTSGINPHYGATRNPYDAEKISGGSSSGSAAVVSAGLCPAALGVDGGGSVRMPAALCGVVGFKPTYGRIPHSGVLPLNWTVGMIGVLAGTLEDALITYAAILGNLPTNWLVSLPPCINLPLLQNSGSVTNLKLAKYTKWFDHCDDAIRETCYQALNLLKSYYRCQILEVTLPELEEMRLAHYVTIGCECDASFGLDFEKLGVASSSGDTAIAFHVYKNFTSREFLNAQRIRFRQMYMHMEIFKEADVIVTPTTGVTAYHVQSDALKCGEFDYKNGAAMLRYQIAGNFLGLPAVTIPVGHDKFGMPIGLQFVGRPWSESTLLHLAHAME